MNKEEAIKIVRSHYPANKQMLNEALEFLIPELKEDENEKIRKEIISVFKGQIAFTSEEDAKKYIAWLEKQGFEPNWCHHKVDLSNCSEEYRKAYYDGWNNCNMQHSQCKSESNDVVKCLINGMKFYYEDNKEATWGTEKFSMKVKDILSWLEKQGEHEYTLKSSNNEDVSKLTDQITKLAKDYELNLPNRSYDIYAFAKDILAWLERQNKNVQGKSAFEAIKEEKVDNTNMVEPKFKVGDWIVTPENKVLHITSIEGTSYKFDNESHYWETYYCDKQCRLWTIADAKDGDVLVASDGSIFIFAGVVDYACKYYVSLTTGNYVKINKEVKVKGGYWETSRAVHPATKEQCALLFQKMREEGYEWDADKKELKKL